MKLIFELIINHWKTSPKKIFFSLLAITLGVSIGYSIHLVNTAALSEFSKASRTLSGNADLHVRAKTLFLDENIYREISNISGISSVAPILELNLPVEGKTGLLKILGIDIFQSSSITPDIISIPSSGILNDTFDENNIFLSNSAMKWMGVDINDYIYIIHGIKKIKLKVSGKIANSEVGKKIAVMDISVVQWKFTHLKKISGVDLKLNFGENIESIKDKLINKYGNFISIFEPIEKEKKNASISRSYRINLSILGFIALFTGGYLVLSTQTLSVIKRQSEFTLLRTVGMSKNRLIFLVILEGFILGVIGSVIGVLFGYFFAQTALSIFGGDLGGGYFMGTKPKLYFEPITALIYFIIGIFVATSGAISPAFTTKKNTPSASLKKGNEDLLLSSFDNPAPAIILIIIGILFAFFPPLFEIPIFGYLSILLILLGTIAIMPRISKIFFSFCSKLDENLVPHLALTRMSNNSNQVAIALGGVLVSFSLMVAMAIMVSSFRSSVENWLNQVLSADIYIRSKNGGENNLLNNIEINRIKSLQQIKKIEYSRNLSFSFVPSKPKINLIARSNNHNSIRETLPLISHSPKKIQKPIWISEAMVDLYGWKEEDKIIIPFGEISDEFEVAGIYRDYARQNGSIQMKLNDYQTLTNDFKVNYINVWLKNKESLKDFEFFFRKTVMLDNLELIIPSEIKLLSMKMFDRSFKVTYILEGIAIIIGIFGIASSFSAQTISRSKEFGMLMHFGVSKNQIKHLLFFEGTLLATIAIIIGFALGLCLSFILIFVINPQSFHWTMNVNIPWLFLLFIALILLISAASTALISGKFSLKQKSIFLVRED